MKIKTYIIRFLLKLGILKPHLLYKGRRISPFPAPEREIFLKEYLLIRLKKSDLPSEKRKFIVIMVEKWLILNNINPDTFSYELLNFETDTPNRK